MLIQQWPYTCLRHPLYLPNFFFFFFFSLFIHWIHLLFAVNMYGIIILTKVEITYRYPAAECTCMFYFMMPRSYSCAFTCKNVAIEWYIIFFFFFLNFTIFFFLHTHGTCLFQFYTLNYYLTANCITNYDFMRWEMYLHGARDINEAITSIDPNASCDFYTNVLGLLLFL